jgi:hypothetical protein
MVSSNKEQLKNVEFVLLGCDALIFQVIIDVSL